MMENPITQVKVRINSETAIDEEKLAKLSQQLRRHLLELDVKGVESPKVAEIPPGAKVGDPVTWGTLLVTLLASGGVLPSLLNMIQAWLAQHSQCSVTVNIGDDQIEVKGGKPSKQQQQLIDAWLAHHSKKVILNG
jgi:hypothetical protein